MIPVYIILYLCIFTAFCRSTDHFNPLYVKPEELDDVDKGGVPAQSDEVSPTQDAEQTEPETTPAEGSTDQND